MNILLTGSTGLIGRALCDHLRTQGHNIFPLYRNPDTEKQHYWFPDEGRIHLDEHIKLDAVIHLAGENIADSRWNQKKKERILDSRINGTRLLTEALARLKHKPGLLISASAIGFYGDTCDNIVDENSQRGTGFLGDIATQWEASAQPAKDADIRTIHIRTGIVLSADGGALKKMLPPFKMGLGGIVGNGRQYMSWISIRDVVQIISTMLSDEDMSGPYNLVAPKPVTNAEFTKSLGHALHRPTIFPMPAPVARTLFGEMADHLLLSSSRVVPARLNDIGYKFIDGDLDLALSRLLENR